ncbi:MAG: YceI family protein [Gammaproteobacteria bacterium]|nr:YceI family protein [Gammaproteobacteria bacterium]NNJ96707.1 YceI family protein [Gammaproteobacteria bacterium]
MKALHGMLAGLLLSLGTAANAAEVDVCAPFTDGVVDQSIVSTMLDAAGDGHLYRIETSSSKVGFCVESPVGLIEGEFKDFTGGLTFFQENVGDDEHALVMVKAASLETDGVLIENMLKGKKFFDVKNFPEILFVSTGFKWVSDTEAILKGDLTMHGVTKAVGFHVEMVEQPGEHEQRIVVKATTLIHRSEFGLTALSPMVSDSVSLCMSVDAVRYGS